VRQAVLATGPALGRCAERHLERAPDGGGEALLRLRVDAGGQVLRASLDEGPLAGSALAGCLAAEAGAWAFPPAARGYEVEVPLRLVAQPPAAP
jgi:hypothetical protein